MIGRSARSTRRTQRGQGLLLLMLMLLVAGAAVLLEGIGSRASNRAGADEHTARALAHAKEALIAWAVSHPGTPGRLPFPDRGSDPGGFDGLSDCVNTPTPPVASNLLLGQLPWRGDDAPGSGCLSQIETWPLTSDLRDGFGQPLWYAVADRLVFQGVQARLNVGLLDGVSDGSWLTVRDRNGVISDRVAAVIIAPGEATGLQDRSLAIDNPSYPAQFLDSVDVSGTSYSNADTDGDFILHETALPDDATTFAFNDRVVYITADELLRAVERRVLGEVAAALWEYRDANGAYPWLSPFADPIATTPASFDGVPGTRVGHLAYNDAADEGTHVQDTGFTITWTPGNADEIEEIPTLGPILGPLLADALIEVTAAVGLEFDDLMTSGSDTFPTPTAPTGNPTCTWWGSNAIADCNAVTDAGTYAVASLLGTLQVRPQRSYDMAYTGNASVPPLGLDGARVRDVSSGATFSSHPDPSAQSIIEVRHTASFLGVPVFSVAKRLVIEDGDTATVDMNGIYLEPSAAGTLPGDLPAWFYANQWDRYVLVEYAGNALPGESLATGTACDPATNCVNLDVIDETGAIGVTLPIHAVVIGASAQIASWQERYAGSAALEDFFEEKNAIAADATAERRPWRSVWDFNDQARAVRQPF